MSHLQLLKKIRETKQRAHYSRAQILEYQQQQFHQLLKFVWHNSPFYKKLYSEHGITEDQLGTLTVRDLPFTTKELLMANFNEAVTDKSLHKESLEEWIQLVKDSHQRYEGDFVVIHTSGSSGSIGIFVYDDEAWDTLKASVITRISRPQLNPFRKIKVAFYGATHGRFAGVSLAADAPKSFYVVKLLSVLEPYKETLEQLNKFKPVQLTGYSSAIAQLARSQLDGDLKIKPHKVFCSGDLLTAKMASTIKKAWGREPVKLYAASESISIAAQVDNAGQFDIYEDLHIMEILDDKDNDVQAGDSGRVVLTNLYNKALPIIRYEMHDIVEKSKQSVEEHPFSGITKIHGRVGDSLPITLDNGAEDTIHPIVLSEFFIPGLEKIQFISDSANTVQLRYVAKEDLDQQIKAEFFRLLNLKGAVNSMTVSTQAVSSIENDPTTGKFKLVI